MHDSATTTEISLFLSESKQLIIEGSYTILSRKKNLTTLAKYGLTFIDAKDILLELSTSNYYKGPKDNLNGPGVIWEFKTQINTDMFYIKLHIENTDKTTGKKLICISFYNDEFAE